jgi:hypothetical protein
MFTQMLETIARVIRHQGFEPEPSMTSRVRRPNRRFVSSFGLENLEGRLAPSAMAAPMAAFQCQSAETPPVTVTVTNDPDDTGGPTLVNETPLSS